MMRRTRGFAILILFVGLAAGIFATGSISSAALAQSADASSGQIEDQPLPPPPGTSATMVPVPETATNPAAPPAPEPPSSSAAPSVAAPSQWVAAQQAQLTVLDKIYGSATTISAKVGAPFAVRFLTVTVLACWVRPPTYPPDTAAFLQVSDTHAPPGSPPEFRGWIFQAEPALSGMNDPATDISVDGCA
jgi:hypothetical protein